jgi:MYXO-CTERM domain-containing protein
MKEGGMRQTLLIVLLLSGACGEQSPAPPSARAAPAHDGRIVGGSLDLGDPETFMLIGRDGSGPGFFGCTATLIGERTLLTAGHCVSCGVQTVEATNQVHPYGSVPDELAADLVTVAATTWQTAPDFVMDCASGILTGSDLALIRLAQAPSAPHRPLNTSGLQQMLGQPVRLVGYGLAFTLGEGFGRRRTGVDRLQALTTTTLDTRGVPASTCFGDSGSAVLASFSDGTERVIGVTSKGNVDCSVGTIGTRVDTAQAFLQSGLAALDSPCGEDDPTCACAADGACTDGCADKSKDPDCSESCGFNGICSRTACAAPDPDCGPIGAPCIAAAQCADGQCLTDPQHFDAYCSKACSSPADCAPGMTCDGNVCRFSPRPSVALGAPCDAARDFCVGGAICVGVGGQAATCRAQCDVAGDCGGQTCLIDAGVPFTGICQQALVVPDAGVPPVSPPSSSSTGCTSAPGGASGVAALLLLLGLGVWRRRDAGSGSRQV